MSRIMCIANQKGGVGKTTTAINLSVGLAMSGARTLLIDLDPQCNATTGLGQSPIDRHPLLTQDPDTTVRTDVTTQRFDMMPGCRRVEDVHALAGGAERWLDRIRGFFSNELKSYEFVLMDCPPSLGPLTETALACSTEVLMPIQCEYFAMEGLTQMIEIIRRVMRQPGNQLRFGGIVLTMYDHTLEVTMEVDTEVRDFFGDIVFQTVVPRDVSVSEAPSHGTSVLQYAPRSRGARSYIELCMEVLDRE